MIITSLTNTKIKEICKLKEKKYRNMTNTFLIEGINLVTEAGKSNLLKEIFVLEGKTINIDIPTTYVIVRDLPSLITELKKDNYKIYGTKVDGGINVKDISLKRKYALVIGNEGNGVSEEVNNLCDEYLYIKMNKEVESLNAGVATSILLYEIKIGKIVNTHGIKGELRLLSKFPYKDKVFINNMTIYIDKKDKEIINTYRKHKNFDMITLKDYNNINEVLKYKGKNVYVNDSDIKLDNNKYLDEELIGLNVIYEDNNKGTIVDIERYDKTVLFNIKNNDKEYLIPYNDNIIDKIDINNKRIYIKDIKGLFD